MVKNTVILIFITISSIISCSNPLGHRGVSEDIKEAKSRGVFEYELIPLNGDVCVVNDSIKIRIKEAWIEKMWGHGKYVNSTIPLENYQLCVNTYDQDIEGITFDWSIGIESDKYIRLSSDNSLIGDLRNLPNSETLSYVVKEGDLFDSSKKLILGQFNLRRKRQ
jgi:hypothetical protein